ncbi:MAG: DUF533 domain-containing protein, partial [Candidatus Sumerlaeia bacterium]|nr:DUF533 domain-containing protein [Candidatus Sumerlaeia bacterium]
PPAGRAAPPPLPPVPGMPNLTAAPAPPQPGGAPAGAGAMPPIALLRAMVAAANADHDIDAEERAAIVQAASEMELAPEERALLEQELARPLTLAALAAEARTPQDARALYAAALLVLEVDTEEERGWLRRLAERLGLAPDAVAAIHADLGHSPL